MRRSFRKLPKRFLRDVRALAAVEFAFWLPILITLVAGGFEMSRAVNTGRELTNVANSIAMMLTTVDTLQFPNASTNPKFIANANCAVAQFGCVSYTDLHYAFDSAMITFPTVLSDSSAKNIPWANDISISLTGVSFTPGAKGPGANGYQANIVWTGGSQTRACGTNPQAVPDTNSPTATTLPTDLFDTVSLPTGAAAPNFEIVVDVTYTWTPMIFSTFFGAITMTRSAFVSPRYVSQILYVKIPGDDGFGKECPGF